MVKYGHTGQGWQNPGFKKKNNPNPGGGLLGVYCFFFLNFRPSKFISFFFAYIWSF
jgi:hypothetical protein